MPAFCHSSRKRLMQNDLRYKEDEIADALRPQNDISLTAAHNLDDVTP
jgi:hypothetical protein